jgi:transposase
MMQQEAWMDLMSFRPLVLSGASWAEIGRLAGCDWRTARRYLTAERPRPPGYGPRPPVAKLIDPVAATIDTWLRKEPRLGAFTVYERLQAEPYRFSGSYETVKRYIRRRRPEILKELGIREQLEQMHRRFEVLAGSQAQVDWGDEGTIATSDGELHVYSFHMVLAYSRDPFCRYVTSMDLGTFWACHTEAFHHFGGVPAQILYDRTKTVVRRHVGRGQDTPLHPEAIAFAEHSGFAIKLCYPERPQTKGRVERQVEITREHVLRGRTFTSIDEMQRAWSQWLDVRRAQVHRTHGEVIAVRAERDRAALRPEPALPYVVCERHIRSVGKDALVSFGASVYSVPWTKVRPRQRVELRVTRDAVEIHTLGAAPELLATHARATQRGSWVVDPSHWDGLPDGTSPAAGPTSPPAPEPKPEDDQVELLMSRANAFAVPVARRDPATYDRMFHTQGGAW